MAPGRKQKAESLPRGLRGFWSDLDRRIFRDDSVASVLRFAADRLAEILDLPLVWIGLKAEDGRIRYPAAAGPESEYLEGISIRWDDSAEGRGPTGDAIRTGRPVTARIATDPAFEPWRGAAREHGLESSVSVPLPGEDGPIGALNMYAKTPSFFTDERIDQIQHVADHLALAIHRQEALSALREERRRLKEAERIAEMGHWEWHYDSGTVIWSDQIFRMLGREPGEVEPSFEVFLQHVHPEDRDRVKATLERALASRDVETLDFRMIRPDGTVRWWEDRWTIRRLGGEPVLTGIAHDITERKNAEEALEHLARHDPLTDLSNRRVLREELAEALHRADRDRPSTLLFLDVDNFKLVNDAVGHDAGDRFLIQFAGLLEDIVRPMDHVVRIGGDEFAVLLEDIGREPGGETADRIRSATAEYRFSEDGFFFNPTVTVGGVVIDRDACGDHTADEFLDRAELAMRRGKEHGKNRVLFYDPAWEGSGRLTGARQWQSRIRSALDEDRFEVFLQRIEYFEDSEAPRTYEAFVRLRESGGLVQPARFIPPAERLGLVTEIDEWMLDAVLDLLADHRDLRIAVNLSAQSIGLDRILSRLRQAQSGHPGLSLEITETAAVQHLGDARRWMEEIRDLEIPFALDDFGTGFASFAYLRTLPVEAVKIDGTIVEQVRTDPSQQAIVRSMVDVCRALGESVVAEWVEDEDTFELLRSYGVDAVQGFHVHRPAPAADVLG